MAIVFDMETFTANVHHSLDVSWLDVNSFLITPTYKNLSTKVEERHNDYCDFSRSLRTVGLAIG